MEFKTDDEVIKFLEDNITAPNWVGVARTKSEELKALVSGKNFDKLLIEKIDHIESADRAAARTKYAKDIRSVFERINQPRINVFSASGGEIVNKIESTVFSDKLVSSLAQFKGQKSIKKYLSESFFRLRDTDPNGVLFLEYTTGENEDIYPTYKSIEDIHSYVSNGQLVDYIIFKAVKQSDFLVWRIVGDKKDWRIKQQGNSFTVIEDETFEHPFGIPPCVILSEIQETGSEVRISPLWPILKDAEDYARDKSVLTIYKFTTGMPRHFRFEKECKACKGVGKTGTGDNATSCETCGGKGNMRKNDVTDVTIIEMPREGEPMIAPNIEGFISPDLETWQQYKDDLKDNEDNMDATYWGTRRMKESTNETATGRFIDVQPVENKLNTFTDSVEWAHNMITGFVENWVFNTVREEHEYHTIYGRGYILETPDLLLDRYNKSRESGSNNTILDKELSEYITAKYQNNTMLMEEMIKKATIEPYVHLGIKVVFDIFGNVEANKKVLFNDFWEQVDTDMEVEPLRKAFDAYFATNNKIKAPEVTPPVNK
jgi:hypothetical protein